MTLLKKLERIIKNPNDVWHYFVGNYRYKLYYSRFNKRGVVTLLYLLMRKHIREQIDYRIKWMDKECYNNGSCKLCGCETTALQMCNKSCDKPCYPPIMDKLRWKLYKKGWPMYENKDQIAMWYKNITTEEPILKLIKDL